YRSGIRKRRETGRADFPTRQRLPQHGTAPLDRKAEPLSLVHRLGHGREPYGRFSRLGRLSGMAQTGRALLLVAAAPGARPRGGARFLAPTPAYSRRK